MSITTLSSLRAVYLQHIEFMSGCCPYLQQRPGGLLPQLHPDGYVVNLWRWRAEVLVLQTGAQEVRAAGFQETDLGGVVKTRFVPGTERRRLSA